MITFIMALTGMCLGSFCHVVIQRRDWYKGRSHCDFCDYILKWYDLIPVISYLYLRGKCRKCRSPIAVSHLAGEIFFGCGFAVAAQYYTQNWLLCIHITVAVIFLCACAVSDIRTKDISVLWLYGGILALAATRCLLFIYSADYCGLTYTFIIGGLLFAAFYYIAKTFGAYIGDGDLDIFLMLYFVFGLYDMIACIFIASMFGTSLYLPLVLRKKYDRNESLPLAPLLYVAFIITLVTRGGGLP